MCFSTAFGGLRWRAVPAVKVSFFLSFPECCQGGEPVYADDLGRKQPLFAITTLLGISSIFKSYPSIGDTALYLSLLSLYRHIFPCTSPFSSVVGNHNPNGTPGSNALHILRNLNPPLRNLPRPSLLPPVDLRRLRQCKLLLRNHPRLEPRRHRYRRRRHIRCAQG